MIKVLKKACSHLESEIYLFKDQCKETLTDIT